MKIMINIKPIIFLLLIQGIITHLPALAQDQINATKQKGCAPFSVTFSASVENIEEYHWQFGNDHESSVEKPTILFEEPGEYRVKLTVKYQNQSTETFEYPSLIQVSDKPNANFITENDTYCFSDTVQFFNTSLNASHYIWDFGDGTNSDEPNPSHLYTDPGNYNVTLMAFNDANCSNILVLENKIHIRDEVVSDFYADKKIVCENEPEITFSPAKDHHKYLWNFGDGTTSNEKNPVHTFPDQQNYEISLTIEDLSGCTSNTVKKDLFKFQKLQVLNVQLSDSVICNDQTITFKNNTKNTKSIQWEIANTLLENKAVFEHNFTNPGLYDLTITHVDKNGCSQTRDLPGIIEVIKAEQVKIDISENEGCAPLTIEFSNNTVNATAFSWEIGDQIIDKQSFEMTFTEAGIVPVKAFTFHSSGCQSEYLIDSSITVHKPVLTTSVSKQAGCVPHETTFSLSSDNIIDFNWNFGNGRSSNHSKETVTYTEPGKYEVSVAYTSENGCKGNLVLDNFIHVYDTTIAYNSPETITICAFEEVKFSGELGHGSWEWYFGDGSKSLEKYPVHQFIDPGVHKVRLKTLNRFGCQVTIENYNEIRVNLIDPVDFDYTIKSCDDALTTFTSLGDESLNYSWVFSNGSKDSGISASRYFEKTGYYPVGLIATDNYGCHGTKIKSVLIEYDNCLNPTIDPEGDGGELIIKPPDPPVNDELNTLEICSAPFEMSFQKPNNNAKGWLWDFKDGTTSDEPDPIHLFQNPGNYAVDLYQYRYDGKIDTLKSYLVVNIKDQNVDFTYTKKHLCDGEEVNFIDLSENVNTSIWNYGDGIKVLETSPKKVFNENGIYQVELTAIDDYGCSKKTVHNVAIGNPYPYLNIPQEICAEESLTLQHNIDGFKSYLWDFGNGQLAEGKNPVANYLSEGSYTINLEVKDENNCAKQYIDLANVNIKNPKATFAIDGDSVSCGTLKTRFINQSTKADSCLWDFGNGTISRDFHPEVEFNPGNYNISLTVYNGNCADTYIKENAIIVHGLEADFSFKQDDICLPITVQFEDKSTNASSWHWNFGDGNTSKLQNPEHIYLEKPKKDIVLTISDSNGCKSNYKGTPPEFYATVFSANQNSGCIPFEVSFTDESGGSTGWIWDLGNGHTSTVRDPEITYQNEGIYDVTLITRSPTGCKDTLSMKEYLKIGHIESNFTVNFPETLCSPLITTFKNESIGADSYQWDFGDGSSSTIVNPVHVYTKVGLFDVNLISQNELGCSDTITYIKLIKTLGPQASFQLSDTILCHPQQFQIEDLSVSAISWEWHWGDGNISNEKNPEYQYEKPGVYDIALLVTDQYGCQELIKSGPLKVIQTPKALFEIYENNYCMSAEVEVKNLSTNLQNPVFKWNNETDKSLYGENPVISFNRPGTHKIELTVINEESCFDTYMMEDPIVIRDTFHLKEPQIFQISVNNENEISIKSNAYNKNNFIYNIIFRSTGEEGNYKVIDTVFNPLNTEFIDQQVSTSQINYSYKVQSHVYCNNPVSLEDLNTYSPIYLHPTALDSSIFLKWTGYQGHNFDKYTLLRKNELDVWEDIAHFAQKVTSYNDIEQHCPSEYEYKVIANNLGGMPFHSMSNIVKIKPRHNIFKNQHVEVVRSTVLDNNSVLTEWRAPTIGPNKVMNYLVLKSSNGSDYQVTSILPKGIFSFIDHDVNVNSEIYNYKISVINTCDVTGQLSNEGNSILLLKQTDEYLNTIQWNPYNGWRDGVKEYLLQKKVDEDTWETIEILPPGTNNYLIDLSKEQ